MLGRCRTTLGASRDQAAALKAGQMARHGRLQEAEMGHEVDDPVLVECNMLEHGQASRIGQAAEQRHGRGRADIIRRKPLSSAYADEKAEPRGAAQFQAGASLSLPPWTMTAGRWWVMGARRDVKAGGARRGAGVPGTGPIGRRAPGQPRHGLAHGDRARATPAGVGSAGAGCPTRRRGERCSKPSSIAGPTQSSRIASGRSSRRTGSSIAWPRDRHAVVTSTNS